jgi:hypothetical protein
LTAAGLGFLFAVLWFDLMFDVQAWRYRGNAADIPDEVVESVARYYRRVTTDARPMNGLVSAGMLAAIAGGVGQLVERGVEWNLVAALVLTILPIGLAVVRIVPMAVRLASERDAIEVRRGLVRSVLVDHLACVVAIALALVLQFL